MCVLVEKVRLSLGSTVSVGYGINKRGVAFAFVGDSRAMQALVDEIAATGRPVVASVEDWQLLAKANNA